MNACLPPETHLPPPALWPPAPAFFISRFPDNAQGTLMPNPLHPSLSLSLSTPDSSPNTPHLPRLHLVLKTMFGHVIK